VILFLEALLILLVLGGLIALFVCMVLDAIGVLPDPPVEERRYSYGFETRVRENLGRDV